MKITYISNRATYFEHEVTIVINEKVIDYIVNTAFLKNGKKWVQNYNKKQFNLRLTTSELKQVKNYFENEFLKYVSSDADSFVCDFDKKYNNRSGDGYSISSPNTF